MKAPHLPPDAGTPRPGPRRETLNASEVGRYVYCARAWWLQRVRGYAPENRAALERGLRRHAAHGQALRTARYQTRAAYVLFALAAVLGIILLYAQCVG